MTGSKLLVIAASVVVGPVLVIVIVLAPASDNPCTPGGSGLGGLGSVVKPVDPSVVTLTSGFGPRDGAPHDGIDLAGAPGTPIYAYADGVVAAAGPASGFGNWIVLDHTLDGAPASTVYGHLFARDVLVHPGETVRAGQHIANVGYAGEVAPPGPAGAHLHFELWRGGTRLGGGHPVDPEPAYRAAPTPDTAHDTRPADPGGGGAVLAALPASVGSEAHWQVDTIRVARAVHARFPQVRSIAGWRPSDPYPDHPSGRAADIMIPDYSSGDGVALGDRIVEYLLADAGTFHVEYLIWRQTYIPATGPRTRMEDRGSDTANHDDHVHVTVDGHGFPTGETVVTDAGDAGVGVAGSSIACAGSPVSPVGGGLAPGRVPPEFAPWYRRAGALCPQITPSLLAAQGRQEMGGFDPHVVSPAGAMGPGQFLPGTWPSYGRDDDGNGTVSPFDIGDAVMAQGRYMCVIAGLVDDWIAHGLVQAPRGRAELYLAGYNAGPDAVRRNHGFPTDATDYHTQTRPYADAILADEPHYAAVNP